MKRSIISALIICVAFVAYAQTAPEYKFTVVKENPITSVKNQNRSGTCWCFAGIGFLESEAIRINGIKDASQYPDFSEMFVVSHSYQARAEKYVRLDGKLNFSAGSEFGDVMHVVADYGLVPQSIQPGTNYGTTLPVHGELDAVTLAFVQAVATKPNKTLTTAWKTAFKGIVDAYLGECPTEFSYNGKTWTPASYRDSFGINAENYVTFTSFTHHPFYKKVILELCDNWRMDADWNVPVDEFMAIIDNAIMNGYTIGWASDVSEKGFGRSGVARLLPDSQSTAGSDQERWIGKSQSKEAAAQGVLTEIEPDQEYRQIGYDNKTTTDDHGMQIFGIAKDQWGNKYYMVKNSWGKTGSYDGIWYASEAFVKGKSMSLMVHKDAVPKEIAKKIGIK